VMERRFGARLLRAADVPLLFVRLRDICRRAGLLRQPDLYYLPAPLSMNACAPGNAERSAIVLTKGLLERMTPAEVAGILAHEVAHIRNNDAMLYLALSRVRELDADALARDLIDDPRSFVTALHKLEHFHPMRGLPSQAALENGLARLLRSHPATSERVGILLRLAA
jgi:heat shock protein HtpX